MPFPSSRLEGLLNNILDLTDPAALATIGSSAQEMTGPWVRIPNPPTQELGRGAHNSGRITGIKYASAKHPGGVNFVVFPDRISVAQGNSLEVYDPHGHLAERLP